MDANNCKYPQAQIIALREQLASKQQQIVHAEGNSTAFSSLAAGRVPQLELSLSCDNLRCDGNGWPPSAQLVISYQNCPSALWHRIGETEAVRDTSNPTFLVTIPLWNVGSVDQNTRSVLSFHIHLRARLQKHEPFSSQQVASDCERCA